ncbi:MAG TPA: PAS domain-containing protein [Bryobacteraceae bacterium]|nr:PAS domain-containing protein [Bryobacteraceae bacterium]
MQLDVRFVATLTMWLALVFTVFLTVIWWTRRTYRGYSRWTAAGLLLVFSLLLLRMRPAAPDWLSIVAANALIVLAAILYLEGAREFRGLAPRNWLVYAAGAIAIGGVVFFRYAVPNLNARAAIMSAFLGIVLLLVSIRLLRSIPPEHKFGLTLTGGMFALSAATLLARSLYCCFGPPISDLLAFSGIHGALALGIAAQMAAFSVGIVLLSDERIVSDLALAREHLGWATAAVASHIETEAVLRESEERFRTVADAAPVMIWVSGAGKLCTFFNKPWLDFRGRSMSQEAGNGWAEGVHPDDRDRCLQIYTSSFDARRPFEMEYRLRRHDGEYRWILDRGTPLRQNGEFTGYIGSCTDITEQRLMAERLLAQKVQLADAQRLANLGSWERDLEDCGFDCSEEFLRILGLQGNPPGTLWAFLQYVHPKDRHRVSQSALEIRSSTSPVEMSYRIVRPDGEVRFVRSIVQAIRDDRGKALRTVGALQDITEQVNAAKLLRESEERLRNAERLVHVGNWHWDLKSNQVSWSDEMFRIFGQPLDYAPSYDGFFQAVIPQEQDRLARELQDALDSKRGFSSEVQILRPDGDVRTITFIAELLLDEEGSPAAMFGATKDITDRKDIETTLLQSQEQLRALTARLVEVQEAGLRELARELHDNLSQDLAALGMDMSTLLRPSAEPGPPLSERLRALQLRVTKMAADVYAISHRLHPAILDELGLNAALREECWAFSERTGIPVEFESDCPSACHTPDVSLCVYRVAQEALHNIAKHARATRVRLTLLYDEGSCTLRIADDGQGFDPCATKGRNSLGLISMRERARLVNGDLRIQSEPGLGTTLEISVALKPVEA